MSPRTIIIALCAPLLAPCLASAQVPAKDMHQYLKGHYVYDRMCVPCHGRRGRGDGEWCLYAGG